MFLLMAYCYASVLHAEACTMQALKLCTNKILEVLANAG